MSYIGIDIGSSQVKAVAYDENGRQLAAAHRKYSYTTPQPGWMELDGAVVINAALATLAECSTAVAAFSPVQAIACSSQGEAFSPVDEKGAVLAPAMISGDTRASAVVKEFADQFGRQKLYRLTGHSVSPMFSIGKLLWLRRYEPGIFNRARYFLCFEDLLCYYLTGKAVMGYPLAGRTMLFNPGTHEWVSELLAACGISEQQLATPQPSGTVVGFIRPEIARKLSLPANVQWVTGGHDQVIGAYGCGAQEKGIAMCAGGSVQCLVPVSDRFSLSDELFKGNLCSYDFAIPERYASVAYSLTGSNLTEYFIREIARDTNGDYSQLTNAMPKGPTSLYVLPYFTPSGTPFFDVDTPACIYGWRFSTSRGELFKGLSEGVALEMKLNYELLKKNGFEQKKLIATGGGFRSREMVQLYADVLGLPLSVCDETEAGCRGAAMLAAAAVSGIQIPSPKIVEIVDPDIRNVELYNRKFQKWNVFCEQVRKLNKCLL